MPQPDPPIFRPNPPHWYQRLGSNAHSNGRRRPVAELDVTETRAAGLDFVNALISQPALRATYYNASRTWHELYSPTADPATLEFGEQLCFAIEHSVTVPAGKTIQLRDAANIHKFAFQTLRRAIFSLTSNDVDPDSDNDNDKSTPAVILSSESDFSWHWPPNGFPGAPGSSPSFSVIDLGFDPANP